MVVAGRDGDSAEVGVEVAFERGLPDVVFEAVNARARRFVSHATVAS